MSGGTCEATAYQAFGCRAAAVCVALGNYHNCAADGGIGPEYVSVADIEALTTLCIAVAGGGVGGGAKKNSLRERLDQGLDKALAKWFRV